MLSKRVSALPPGEDCLFEPKWDGFRCTVFFDGDQLYLQSRDLKPLGRYFPELEAELPRVLPGPIVLDGEGVPLDMGRRRRLPTPAQRLAVLARDRHCSIPGCDLPAEWCQVHHIVHWADGGNTDLGNLLLVCHGHHREVHEGDLVIDGTASNPRFTRRDGTELGRSPP